MTKAKSFVPMAVRLKRAENLSRTCIADKEFSEMWRVEAETSAKRRLIAAVLGWILAVVFAAGMVRSLLDLTKLQDEYGRCWAEKNHEISANLYLSADLADARKALAQERKDLKTVIRAFALAESRCK